MKQVFSAPTPLNREKSNMNLRTMHGVLHVRGVRGGGRREGGKCKEAENHKFLRGPDKSCATFSEMNTLQIFPALILLARVRKTLLAARPPGRGRRGTATQRARPVSLLGQILSRLTQCGEYNVSKEGASHSLSTLFHAGRRTLRNSKISVPHWWFFFSSKISKKG